MEYSSPKLFKNHSTRGWFVDGVLLALSEAQGHAELICIYEYFESFLLKMKNGHEYDQFSYDLINARYQAMHIRIDESREWIYKLVLEFQERAGHEQLYH